MSVSTFEEITKTEPERSLTEPLKKSGGRNHYGRITRSGLIYGCEEVFEMRIDQHQSAILMRGK